VPGVSATGHLAFGPNSTLPPGTYNVDFVMRSTSRRL
jgi:hypothetical protein